MGAEEQVLAAVSERSLPPLAGAWYGIAVLATASLLASLNNTLIILSVAEIKQSLGLSDTQIGILTGLAITLMTAVATYPMGWLADRYDRRILLAICVILWSGATIGFGFATGFATAAAWATLMSVSEAVLGPMTYSVVPDLFPRRLWIAANYVMYIASLIGAAIGFVICGQLLAFVEAAGPDLPFGLGALEPWRAALILSTVAGPVLAGAVLLVPLRRRIVDTVVSSTTGMFAFMRRNLRSLVGVFLGFGIAYAGFGTLKAWAPPAMTRVFGQTAAEVGSVLGVGTAVASFGGIVMGWLLLTLGRRWLGETAAMRVAQAGIALALVSMLLLMSARTATQAYSLILLATAFLTMSMSLSPAILQFLTPSTMRGRVIALGGMFSLMFGSFSPVLVGFLSDHVFVAEDGLVAAVVWTAAPALVLGFLFMQLGVRTIPATIAEAERLSA